MHKQRNYITAMDFALSSPISLPQVLRSPSLPPLQSPELPTDTPQAPKSMPLPPEAIYSSKEELYTSIQAWAAQHYYAFRIRRSTKIHSGSRTKITYNCDRCGPPPPEIHPQKHLHARTRQTTTRKTGCKFSVIAIQRIDMQWELRCRPGAEYSTHNHPPSQSISSHPAHRKLLQGEINQVKSLYNVGKSIQTTSYNKS
jgi:hypothetical protein